MTARIAGFPARLCHADFGAHSVDLFVVDDLEALVDRNRLLRDSDIPEPPYWAHLWVGSRALARHLASSPRRFTSAVDIGCGVGLAGLVAARRGARTLFFDYAEPALHFARESLRYNGLDADFVVGDLRRPALKGHFDLCLAADTTYDPELQRALATFLSRHLAADGVALCAESVRNVDRGFADACHGHGLIVNEEQLVETDEGSPVPIRLTTVVRR